MLLASGLQAVAATEPAVAQEPPPEPPPSLSERYKADVLADNPSVYYRLDELQAGVVADSSGNLRDAQHTGDVLPGVDGTFPGTAADDLGLASLDANFAVSYDSGAGLPFGGSARTLEFWFNTTSSGEGWLAHYGQRWGVYKESGASTLRVYTRANCCSDSTAYSTPWPVNDGQWHHVALTYDGNGVTRLYLDGSLLGTRSDGTSVSSSTGLRIGGLPGSYDEIAVYAAVFDDAKVADRWAKATMPSTQACPVDSAPGVYAGEVMADAPLVYLRGSEALSEPDGGAVLDHSGNCLHATSGPSTTAVSGAI